MIANLALASANAAANAAAAVGVWHPRMVRANDERGQQQRAATQQQRATMQDQREAEERRHEKNMTALKALIAGRQTAASETVTERTTPADDGREQRAPEPFPADETSKSSDCRGRAGRKSRCRRTSRLGDHVERCRRQRRGAKLDE